jgi:hypothetical protein
MVRIRLFQPNLIFRSPCDIPVAKRKVALYVDERASGQQREALAAIFGGQAGATLGMSASTSVKSLECEAHRSSIGRTVNDVQSESATRRTQPPKPHHLRESSATRISAVAGKSRKRTGSVRPFDIPMRDSIPKERDPVTVLLRRDRWIVLGGLATLTLFTAVESQGIGSAMTRTQWPMCASSISR